MSERDPARLADELEREAASLQERTAELEEEVNAVREDWERKRADSNVPGALPKDRDQSEGGAGEHATDAPS
jgi:hypothetical protein